MASDMKDYGSVFIRGEQAKTMIDKFKAGQKVKLNIGGVVDRLEKRQSFPLSGPDKDVVDRPEDSYEVSLRISKIGDYADDTAEEDNMPEDE